jgi:uncharacterized repeat protein (TIGR04052 family)
MSEPRSALVLVTLFALASCADGSGTPANGDAGPADAASGVAFELRFEGRVGAERFRCGATYTGVGTSGATATAGDLRFFIHDVKLLQAGREVPLALDTVEPWQSARVALIDLEDKTGGCSFGTTGTNDVARGRAPAGTYSGVAFTIGMPEELNHVNVDLASSPLASSKLQWDWTNGFIHFASQLDSTKTMTASPPDGGAPAGVMKVPPFYAHVGSSLCGGDPGDGGTAICQRKNRPVIKLEGFDPTRDTIVVDLKKLFERSNLDVNTDKTIPGCMSGPNDPECPPIFEALGLDFQTGAGAATPQRVFSREAR